MTLRVKLEIAAVVLVLLLVGIGLYSYQIERENRIRAEATTQAQQDVQKQLAQQVSDLAKQMAARDAVYQSELQTLGSKFQSATSPAQIAQLVAGLMGLKQPVTITTPPATPQDPHPLPVAQVPLEDAPQVKAYVEQCETCKLNLAKATSDAADRAKQAELAQQTIDSLKKGNDTLTVALKGGTWKQRAWRDTKTAAFGGAVVLILACALGHCPK